MYEHQVICMQCGAEAEVKGAEGTMFPSSDEQAAVTLIINCPFCGRREQPAINGNSMIVKQECVAALQRSSVTGSPVAGGRCFTGLK